MSVLEEQNRKRNNKGTMPRLTYLTNVHPRLHFCRDAALMRLSGGLDRLVYADRPESRELYGLYLNGVPLAEAKIPDCGTCGTFLWAGYGDGLINEAECAAVRDQINNGYVGLKRSADVLAPMIGLMKSGLYLVADFDLFPVQKGRSKGYFWDVPDYNGELHFDHWYTGERVSHYQPLFLAPSQRASHLDPDRVDTYRRRIQEGDTFPRAIALYMNGGVALLLDGHHKAAACAAEGVPVKTLVIFQVAPKNALESALSDQKRLYLQAEAPNAFCNRNPLHICDGQGIKLGVLNCMESENKKQIKMQKPEEIPWGRVPDEYRTAQFNDYPDMSLLTRISELPSNRIRALIESEMKKGKDMHDMHAIKLLRNYAALFPEGKWLSASERAWLAREDQEFNPTEIWGAPV